MSKINESSFYGAIAAHLKARRLELGLTQGQITSALGIERTTLAHIEAGRQKPSLHQFFLLCHELHIEPSAALPSWDGVEDDEETEMQQEMEFTVKGAQTTLTPALSQFLKSALQTGAPAPKENHATTHTQED